jgi:hypothetical protein
MASFELLSISIQSARMLRGQPSAYQPRIVFANMRTVE